MFSSAKIIAGSLVLLATSASFAQSTAQPEPRNIVQLSASGTVEVQQDLLVMTLATNKDGTSAAAVQTQLRQAIDSALALAKSQVQAGQLDVRTGQFGLYPRYSKDGKITGWQGRASVVLEGRDFARITTLAGKMDSLAVEQVSFGLSREARAQVEGDAQMQAIERFKTHALDLAKGFGFSVYTLREVSVNSNDYQSSPRPRMMAAEAKFASAGADAPIPVEAGKAQVTVNISGSVQMR